MQQQAGHPESVDSYEDRDILRGTLAELDENGQPKEGGIVVETASLMPAYFKSDDQKKIFEDNLGWDMTKVLHLNYQKNRRIR